MTQMQAGGDYELQLCVLLTGVNSGGLPALIEWDFFSCAEKLASDRNSSQIFFRMFRIPPELWLTHCWEPSLVSWQIIGVTLDNCSLEDCGQEGGDVQERHPNSFVLHFCFLSIAGSSFDPSHLWAPNHSSLDPWKFKFNRCPIPGAASLLKVLNVFFFKSIPKAGAAKNGGSWTNHQCKNCNCFHSDVFKWHSQTKFLSKVFNHQFPNIWPFFGTFYLKYLHFFQIPSCNDRLILLFAGCIHPDSASTGKIYSLVIIMK